MKNRNLHPTVGSRRRGSVLVMSAAGAVFLLGLLAMVTDVGWMYFNQNKMQTGVNAAWKAAFDELSRSVATGGPISSATDDRAKAIREHAKAVARQNGVVLTDNEIIISSTSVRIQAQGNVDLFFARILGYDKATVSAARGGAFDNTGMGAIPLAIPHGETADLTRSTYQCNLFNWDTSDPSAATNQGFTASQVYILKLGSGNPQAPPEVPQPPKIMIAMGPGRQSDTGYLRAYGAVWRCLRKDAADTADSAPVDWLLGYDDVGTTAAGGSFMLPDTATTRAVLGHSDFTPVVWKALTAEQVAQVYNDMKNRKLAIYTLTMRPRIAVYSSQSGLDPVEITMRDAKIPWGEYSKTMGRLDTFDVNQCSHVYDAEVLNNALDGYHWVHLHHEDFTGGGGGCHNYDWTCYDFWSNNALGPKSTAAARLSLKGRLCSYCNPFYDANSDTWGANYKPTTANGTGWNCTNYRRRCVDKKAGPVIFYRDLFPTVTICDPDADRPSCREYNRLKQIADAAGFTDDPGSSPKPQRRISITNPPLYTMPLDDVSYFVKADRVQKMKWAVARKIRDHVSVGGFLYAQCFAIESLDLALLQSAINAGDTVQRAFDATICFEKFAYQYFPRWRSPMWYSTINAYDNSADQPFTLTGAVTEAPCQNHDTRCDTGRGHTSAATSGTLKNSTVVLGTKDSDKKAIKYMRGKYNSGTVVFTGGHYIKNTQTARLVLNNVLMGSLVDKPMDGVVPVAGKNKNNYGPIDPDNYNGGGANDYRDRFMYGFQDELNVNYRIITESGNMAGPTDQAVDYRLRYGDVVVVPITDIPPETGANNKQNEGAQTVYDLQGQDHPSGAYLPDPANPNTNFGSSVRVIGFAIFQIINAEAFDSQDPARCNQIGFYQPGQVKGRFIDYLIKPGEIPLY